VKVRLLYLVAGSLTFWLLVALPARWLGGGDRVVLVTLALALLCLVPAAVTLALGLGWLRGPPEQRLAVVFGGTAIRMPVVLGTAWALHANVEVFGRQAGFWLWLALFYLFILGLEVTLLLTGAPAAGTPTTPTAQDPVVCNGR
jgi:hypothetical protein